MLENPDVLIVGAGAGGGAAAWRLCAAGKKVLVLEAGPSFDPATDYKQDRSDWETSFPTKPGSQVAYEVAELQDLDPLNEDFRSWNALNGLYVKGNKRESFGYHHVRGIGGSSLHFTGEAHRMNPKSMRMKSDFGVGADWPVNYSELAPYWQIAEQLVGVAGPSDDRRCPRSTAYPLESHSFSYASSALLRGAQALGLGHQPNSLAVLSAPYDGRPECNYCGGCLRGCQRIDKGSVDVTYLKHALLSGNCSILTGVEVLNVETTGEIVTGVVASYQGSLERFQAPIIMLSCGAVETPRLLLNSVTGNSPDGLANESGQVGQNFMETILTTSSALHPEQLGSHRGLPVDWLCWDYNSPDAVPGVIGGCRFGPSMAESDLVGPAAYAGRVVDGWGHEHKNAMREVFGRVLSIASLGECLPNKNTYIDLSSTLDSNGLPLARIHSHLQKDAVDRLKFMTKTCREILDSAGCGEIFEEFTSLDAFSSTHVFGTCRMGVSQRDSVVDADCRSHRWKNLFIADASVFPSSGGGEAPGLTIQALSIRAGDRILA